MLLAYVRVGVRVRVLVVRSYEGSYYPFKCFVRYVRVTFVVGPVVVCVFCFEVAEFASVLYHFLFFSVLPGSCVFVRAFGMRELPGRPFVSQAVFLSVRRLSGFVLIVTGDRVCYPSRVFYRGECDIRNCFGAQVAYLACVLPDGFVPYVSQRVTFRR